MRIAPLLMFSAAFAATITTAKLVHRTDPCALPSGVTTSDPTLVAHAMACRDLEAGRITQAEYRAMILPAPAPIAPQWATSVRAVSSEYSPDAWNAQNVLGPPDVYPAYGDIRKAWASREQDAAEEFIEVGFAQPMRASALQVVQTFNPGAIATVELITASGQIVQIHGPANSYTPGSTSRIDMLSTECTDEPIVAARVSLASGAVPGWNEIDAIGLVGCKL